MASKMVAPTLKWLTVGSGALLCISGIGTAITVVPFDIFTGIFNFLFGMIIVGAQFEVEFILKEVAFIKRYWGRGIFFLYLGIPLLRYALPSWLGGQEIPAADSNEPANTNPMAKHAEFIDGIVGGSLTANGLLNLVWSCTGAPKDADGNEELAMPLAAQTGASRGSVSAPPTV
eukprot:COSAG05_NODE_2918_length_2511_cov_2.004146_2_plen_174_part_00